MLINQIVPLEMKDRICIHCQNGTTYLIAEPEQGKTSETIRQAVFRRGTILSTEPEFYHSCGMKHFCVATPHEVSYMDISGIFLDNEIKHERKELHLCVDNGKKILEQILSKYLNVPVIIDFMALEG
jgi:hypothetical protein